MRTHTLSVHTLFAIPIFALSTLAFAEEGAGQLKLLDSDGDGRVSATEYTASPGKTRTEFTRIDRDADGYLSAAEIDSYQKARKASAEPEEEEG